jgi:hypothetical protein
MSKIGGGLSILALSVVAYAAQQFMLSPNEFSLASFTAHVAIFMSGVVCAKTL